MGHRSTPGLLVHGQRGTADVAYLRRQTEEDLRFKVARHPPSTLRRRDVVRLYSGGGVRLQSGSPGVALGKP